MYCPRCGQPITPDDTSCPRCRLVFTTDRQYAPRAAPPPRKLPLAWKLVLGAVVLLFLTASPVLIILLFAEDLGGEEPDLLPGSMPTTASPREPFATPTDAPNGREEAIGPGDVFALPAGLSCRGVQVRHYRYVVAMDYWRLHGRRDRLDVDGDGIPCEGAYPATEVRAYWGTWQRVTPNYEGVETLPVGLGCAGLRERDHTYGQTLDYWVITGHPERMDDDLDGVPCEGLFPLGVIRFHWYR